MLTDAVTDQTLQAEADVFFFQESYGLMDVADALGRDLFPTSFPVLIPRADSTRFLNFFDESDPKPSAGVMHFVYQEGSIFPTYLRIDHSARSFVPR